MKRTKKRTKKGCITVTLIRPTEEDLVISVPVGTTVGEALEEFDFDLPAGQTLYAGDSEADYDSELENDDHLVVVGKKDGGQADEPDEEEEDKDNEAIEAEEVEEEESETEKSNQ